MIKHDHFFRFNVSLMYSDQMVALTEKQGIKGVGIFVALLVELRIREDYRMNRASLPTLARRWDCTLEEVEAVTNDYELFESYSDETQGAFFSSPYLDEVMEAVRQQQQVQRTRGLRRSITAKRSADGRFTSNVQPAEQSTAEQSTATKSNHPADYDDPNRGRGGSSSLQPLRSWEAYVDEAFAEQSWMEVQAMHSKLGRRLLEHADAVIGLFKQHIRTYGKEQSVLSLRDAKSYFSNFVRPGTPTCQRVEQLLTHHDAIATGQDVYRHEQRDPVTGQRSYCGMPIPETAPPRPSANSIWDECLWQWE